jgi:hypothetical protein
MSSITITISEGRNHGQNRFYALLSLVHHREALESRGTTMLYTLDLARAHIRELQNAAEQARLTAAPRRTRRLRRR